MKFSKISITLLIITFLGCTKEPSSPAPQAQKQYRASNIERNFIDDRTIVFENLEKEITYMADLKLLEDGRFSFVDTYYTSQAYVFNSDGTLHCELGKRGEGPGEYESPTGLTTSKGSFYLTSTNARLNVYDKDCVFEKMNHLPSNVTIAKGLHTSGDGNLLLPVFSRYSKKSIYLFSESGESQKEFSQIDKDFPNGFDTFNPQGSIIVQKNQLLQFFNHRYEVIFFDDEYKESKRIRLHSSLYVPPDYAKAKTLNGGRSELAYRATFTQFIGLKPYKDGYVTVLRSWPSEKKSTDVIEFWDNSFMGTGRYQIPEEEQFVGSWGDELIFFKVDDMTSKLIFRKEL